MGDFARLAQKPREEHFVVLDVSQDCIRAGLGIHETLRRPTVEIDSRVGLRLPRASAGPVHVDDYLVGPVLEEAERAGESLDILWPVSVGAPYDAAQNGNALRRRAQTDGITDWHGFEALLSYVLFTALGLPTRPFAYHLQLALPTRLTAATHELITQLCFERLHLPALILSERPLLSVYAVNSVTGVVIEIGRHSTEISVILESVTQPASATRSYVGQIDLDNYLCHLLLSAQSDLPHKLSSGNAIVHGVELHSALLAIVKVLRDGDFLSFASAALSLNVAADGSRLEEETSDSADVEMLDDVAKALISGQVANVIGRPVGNGTLSAAAVAKSQVTVVGDHLTMPNPMGPSLPAITVGPERHRFAEPLFDPSVLSHVAGFGISYSRIELDQRACAVPEAVAQSVKLVHPGHRPVLWDTMVVMGPGSARGVPPALVQALSGFVPSGQGKPRLAKIPEHFPEYKNRLDLASFLGASIVAKVGFLDSSGQFWVNKADYASGGPTIVSRIEKPV